MHRRNFHPKWGYRLSSPSSASLPHFLFPFLPAMIIPFPQRRQCPKDIDFHCAWSLGWDIHISCLIRSYLRKQRASLLEQSLQGIRGTVLARPWSKGIMELSFPRTFAPGSESSIGGTFAPWNFRSLELSLPGAKVPWNFRSLSGSH